MRSDHCPDESKGDQGERGSWLAKNSFLGVWERAADGYGFTS